MAPCACTQCCSIARGRRSGRHAGGGLVRRQGRRSRYEFIECGVVCSLISKPWTSTTSVSWYDALPSTPDVWRNARKAESTPPEKAAMARASRWSCSRFGSRGRTRRLGNELDRSIAVGEPWVPRFPKDPCVPQRLGRHRAVDDDAVRTCAGIDQDRQDVAIEHPGDAALVSCLKVARLTSGGAPVTPVVRSTRTAYRRRRRVRRRRGRACASFSGVSHSQGAPTLQVRNSPGGRPLLRPSHESRTEAGAEPTIPGAPPPGPAALDGSRAAPSRER